MKHFLTRIVPCLLPACVVDTPVVQGDDDRLGAGLHAWCASTCDRFIRCGAPDDPATCRDNCTRLFNGTFVGKGDTCSEAALRSMDCVEAAPCTEPSLGSACIENEIDLCTIAQGQVVCHTADDGTGGAGAAGGSAGYAGGAGFLCAVEIDGCSDSNIYELQCDSSDGAPICQCSTNRGPTKTFEPESLDCPISNEAVELCDWPIARIRDLTEPEAALCSTYEASGPGGPGTECTVTFDDCTDNHQYRLRCGGVPEATSCSCLIDGSGVSAYSYAEEICPSVTSDADSGVLAIYEACGFEIVML